MKIWLTPLIPLMSCLLLMQCASTSRAQMSSRIDFGLLPLHAAVHSLPDWAIEGEYCQKTNFEDCYFYDKDGVKYSIFQQSLETKEVDVSNSSKYIPFGISYTASSSEAIADLSERLGLNFRKIEYNGGEKFYSNGIDNEGSQVVVTYDRDGHLVWVAIWRQLVE